MRWREELYLLTVSYKSQPYNFSHRLKRLTSPVGINTLTNSGTAMTCINYAENTEK